ncbi:Gfo/Idh/MocA family protein [Paenibacillus sp. XY044]|uniref:Gfo/Idh/MocA family protein n=1 Tax=Paenibacillus sp. XY044 TaxID=2026089 RepID=UPI000B987A10|nr:Gfo/Idh/MocA family oxidoreductase [Paenibacillus sp. XY044]OZB91052.1 oxidoreductase [Paenibacillus sp. XY044]
MRVGVIGAGVMGENHVRVYTALSNYCELIGIYDADQKRAQHISAKFQTMAFESLEDLLDQVDAVSIAVPTFHHYQVGLACIAKGVHMLMEKPLAQNMKEGKDLIKRAAEAGVKLQVGHIELYNPVIRVLQQIIEQEDVVAVDIHRMSPFEARWQNVNVVDDLMIHDIYILHHLFHTRTDAVQAVGYADQGTIRHAAALIQMDNGLIVQVTASYITEEKIRTIRIVTKTAFIQADLLDKQVLITRSTRFYQSSLNMNYTQQNIVEKIAVPIQEPLWLQLLDFITCIKNGTQPNVPGEGGLLAMEITGEITKKILKAEESR